MAPYVTYRPWQRNETPPVAAPPSAGARVISATSVYEIEISPSVPAGTVTMACTSSISAVSLPPRPLSITSSSCLRILGHRQCRRLLRTSMTRPACE